MGIVFNVNRIGIKSGFSQNGPTCWYYAAKMLRKFHNIDKTEMRDLHALRRIITELSNDKDLPTETMI